MKKSKKVYESRLSVAKSGMWRKYVSVSFFVKIRKIKKKPVVEATNGQNEPFEGQWTKRFCPEFND